MHVASDIWVSTRRKLGFATPLLADKIPQSLRRLYLGYAIVEASAIGSLHHGLGRRGLSLGRRRLIRVFSAFAVWTNYKSICGHLPLSQILHFLDYL